MKNILLILFVIISLTSCKKDILELNPISQVDSDDFYSNNEELDRATIAIYDGLQALPLREFALTEMRSDNSRSKSGEGDWGQFDNYNVLPTNQQIGVYWTANYNVIFRCNRVLENLAIVSDSSLKNQLEGESKFNRALAHFNLVRAYGGVPVVDKVVGITEYEYFDRNSVTEVYTFIIGDLLEAIQLLPSKGTLAFGRATKAAAQGILAKVYLNTKNYVGAQNLTEEILVNSSYKLENNYRDIFYNEGNDEILFAIPYKNDDINESQDFSFEMTAGGVRSGLNYLTDDFIAKLNNNDTIRRPILQNQSVPAEVGKFLSTSLNARLCGNDWIVLRLADVYLMHVEAIMAGFSATQNLSAITSYNMVRERVKLPTIATDGSGEITLSMLLNERRYELAFENHRLYDLLRTGQAMQVLSNYASQEGSIFTSTDLLLPIPLSEINISNGLLTQNPGY